MRTLNTRFAAGLLLILTLFGVGVYALHRHQFSRIAADLRVQMEEAQTAGQSDEAIKLAYQYLEFAPDNVEILEGLAGWLEQRPGGRKHQAHVAGLLERALQIDAKRSDLRRRVVAIDLKRRQWGECLNHLERLIAETPDDPELLANLGVCQEAIAKPQAAAESFEKSLKLDPKRVATSLDYAALLQRHLHRPDDAKKILDDTVRLNPDNVDARLGLARMLKTAGKYAEAAAAVKEAVRLAPDNLIALLTAADVEQTAGKYVAARGYYEQARALDPKNAQLTCSLAWLLLCEGKSTEAAAQLEAVLKERPDHADALTLLGDILALDGKIDALARVVADLNKLRQSDPTRAWNADYLNARLLMRRTDYAAAATQLEELRVAAGKRPGLAKQANYLLAQCYEQLHDRPRELEAHRRALDGDANSGYFRLDYARALTRGGDFATAATEIRAAVQRSDAPVRLVIEVVGDFADRARRFGGATALKELEKALEPVRGDDPNPHAAIAKIELLRRAVRCAEGLRLMDRYLAAHPNNVDAIALQVQLLDDAVGPERAAATLEAAEKRLGDQPAFRVARLRLFTGRPNVTTQVLLTAAEGADKFNPEDRARVLAELAQVAAAIGDQALLVRAWEMQRTARADHVAVRLALLRNCQDILTFPLLNELSVVEGPNGKAAQLFAAERLLKQNDATTALNQLNAAAKLFAGDAAWLYLRGRAEEMLGQASAKQTYADALDAGLLEQPHDGLLAASRVFLEESPLFDRLRLDADRPAIRTLLPLAPASLRPSLADRILRSNATATAPQLVWFGRFLADQGASRSAEAAFARATDIAPLSDEAWSARLAFHAGKQDTAKVQELVVQAKRTLPPERAAVALIAAGLPNEAPSVVQPAVANTPAADRGRIERMLQTGQVIEARQQLQTLIDRGDATADEKAWARRTLAVNLTIEPSHTAFQRSLALLAANPDSDDNRRATAAVYAAQRTRMFDGGTTARAEAIRRLRDLPSPIANDLVMLARLARAEQNTTQYREIMERLRDSHDYAAAVFVAQDALRTGDPMANQRVALVARLGSDRFETMVTLAIQAALAGRSADAVKGFQTYIQAAGAGTDRAARCVRCGHAAFDILHSWPVAGPAIEQLRTSAISWYRTGLGKDPQALLYLVTLYGEANRLGEALDLLQSSSTQQFQIETRAAAYVTALRRGSATPEQLRAVERLLAEKLKEKQSSSAMQLALADLYEQTGRTPQAIGIYRAILDRDPNNLVAANNLAWTAVAEPAKIGDALRLIADTIDRHGPLDDLLDTRGRLLIAAGQFDAGLRDLLEAADASPNAARFAQLAVVYRQAGRAADAKNAMATAKRYGLTSADVPTHDADAVRELTKN